MSFNLKKKKKQKNMLYDYRWLPPTGFMSAVTKKKTDPRGKSGNQARWKLRNGGFKLKQ